MCALGQEGYRIESTKGLAQRGSKGRGLGDITLSSEVRITHHGKEHDNPDISGYGELRGNRYE